MQRCLDENRQFCSRLPNILAVLKSHLKSDEISFRKLFSMKNTLLNSMYKMLMPICWLLLLLACSPPSCTTGIINLTVSVGWAFCFQSTSRHAFLDIISASLTTHRSPSNSAEIKTSVLEWKFSMHHQQWSGFQQRFVLFLLPEFVFFSKVVWQW